MNLFDLSDSELQKIGAFHTVTEIKGQPLLWRQVFDSYLDFSKNSFPKNSSKTRVVFTGAGTSAYVGDVLQAYLTQHGDTEQYEFVSAPTTSTVSAPADCLIPNQPTLLVSFARSGNSPESVAAIQVANQFCRNVRHLIITCDGDGELAEIARAGDPQNYKLWLMPEASNDQAFAMTGSFSSMLLSAGLLFDCKHSRANKAEFMDQLLTNAQSVLERTDQLTAIGESSFSRIVYLGSGALAGLTREAQLKILELTAGKIATIFDSSMGFRHGPKSFINETTLVIVFISPDAYTQQYDLEILEEIQTDDIASAIWGFGTDTGSNPFNLPHTDLPELFSALDYILAAQIIAVTKSVAIGNTPDTPSANGTVNRVVKGVTIHPLV
ncbi:MAG: SIS domain-containing protein [Bifidobacteriaceae bacterium]|jgi:tagatose-6-phosphate ketose/aldose isomerase|nr:SIS domain-containing protein [Bifidobacteriaceae bacterium]